LNTISDYKSKKKNNTKVKKFNFIFVNLFFIGKIFNKNLLFFM